MQVQEHHIESKEGEKLIIELNHLETGTVRIRMYDCVQ